MPMQTVPPSQISLHEKLQMVEKIENFYGINLLSAGRICLIFLAKKVMYYSSLTTITLLYSQTLMWYLIVPMKKIVELGA